MPPCLTPEQFDDLLEGRVPFEVGEAHLEQCAHCRDQFLAHARVGDEDGWRRAAFETQAADTADVALLAEFKKLDGKLAGGRAGKAVDHAALFDDDADAVQIHPELPAIKAARGGRTPTVPGFEILGELGRGGMGVVYKAKQIAHDRAVALKMILSGHHASAEDLGRFHDEAEAVSRLRHPHIVQIFEVGQVDDRLYFVLEFVEGGTLADRIKGKAMHARSSAQLMESLARAMHYAHQRGIIHRDLKPANVLLHGRKAFLDIPEDLDRQPEEWDFRRFMPKITDFGLAKLMDRASGMGHTASGDVVGTPSYMAPEQAQGKPMSIGPRTDVYSLGAILYEMLTGKPPFHGATPMDTLFQVHTQEPIAPRKLVRDIPPALETICLKCLRKDPGSRYESAEALAEDLRLFLEGQPIQTRGMRRAPFGKLGKRLGSWLAVGLIFVLAVAVCGLMVTTWMTNADQIKPVAKVEAPPANREAARLRLRLALADCERGDTVRGLFDLAALLEDAGRDATLPEYETARVNLAAWSRTLPTLEWLSPARDAAFAPSGDIIITYADGNLTRFSPVGEAMPLALPDAANLHSLTISADGSSLAGIAPDGVRWYDLALETLSAHITTLPNPERPALSPDGSAMLVKSLNDGNALWLVTRTDPKQHKVERLDVAANVTALAWHPSGTQVLLGFADGNVEIKPLRAPDDSPQRFKLPASVTGVGWLNDGATMALATADGFVRFRNASGTTAIEPAAFRAHAAGAVHIAAHRNGLLLTAGADREVKLWRPGTVDLLAAVPNAAALQRVEFSAKGDAFLTLEADGNMRVWSLPETNDGVAGGEMSSPLVLFGVEFEPGLKVARTTDERHHLRRWDVITGKEIEPRVAPTKNSWPVAYFGDRYLTLAADGVARLLMGDGHFEPLQPPARPEFRSAGFSSDGKRLLVAGADGLRMYDTQTAIAVGPPMAIVDIRAAGFSVDGKHVVARSPTGSHSWPLPDPAMPSGEAWRYWLNRHTAIDRAADGTLRFLRRLEWKGTLGEPRP